MFQLERVASRRIVLMGIGHTNAYILKEWCSSPLPDTELVCISDFSIATYSGMLPAVLAGQKTDQAMEIDLVRLCAKAKARFIPERVEGLDRENQTIHLENRTPLRFDALSIGIGSIPASNGVNLEQDNVVTIKPMQTFLNRLKDALEIVKSRKDDSLSILIVGGGAAGIEISCCLPGFLEQYFPEKSYDIRIVNRGSELLSSSSNSVRKCVEETLDAKQIQSILNSEIMSIQGNTAKTCLGDSLDADLVIWATGAAPPEILEKLNLPLDERGFLATSSTLQIQSGEPIFAVGDTGTILSEKLPKAGVFAVREGPILWENLKRTLKKEPLKKYHPQRSFLRLLNTGDKKAIAEWFGIPIRGRWVMSWKNYIDTKFIDKYQIQDRETSASQMKMTCRGCGSKLGSPSLYKGLERLNLSDDAAIISHENKQFAVSTDFFSAPFRDPWLSGRVAAIHAMNDLWATGVQPTAAMMNLVVPDGPERDQSNFIKEIVSGAEFEFGRFSPERKINLAGGHTSVGPQTEVGFTVFGHVNSQNIFLKKNAKPGDQIFVTKSLGTGVLLAAHAQSQCRAQWWNSLINSMLLHSNNVSLIAIKNSVSSATDISGFGLAGHLLEIMKASGTRAVLKLAEIPILKGAIDLSRQGIRSSLYNQNYSVIDDLDVTKSCQEDERFPLLFDPQTCGGLIILVSEKHSQQFQQDCEDSSIAINLVGNIVPRSKDDAHISVRI